MLLGVMSDSHDNLGRIREGLRRLREAGADVLLHAGDFVAPFALKEILKFEGTVYAVFGNNDGERAGLRSLLPDLEEGPRRVELGKRRITLLHDEQEMRKRDLRRSDLIVIGHSHHPEIRQGKPLIVNPGECGGWLTGKSTVATVDTETLEVKLIELGGR